MTSPVKSIIIFASGGGSNAKAIYEYAFKKNTFQIAAICSDKENPGVKDWADKVGIPFHHIPAKAMANSETHEFLKSFKPDLIVLAGYLRLIPAAFIHFFDGKTINIHPALLPKYGGKGMYGHFVHEAVVANSENETGLTIHWVNANYDEGHFICQVHIAIQPQDTPIEVAAKVLQQEHHWYPQVIEQCLNNV